MYPLISIIIPVYNVAPYIERCLESVISQSYENLEIILVDDCGSDNSMDIVRDFCSSHVGNFVLLNHERNRGLSAARNTGVKHAKGDYLFFLDSDDELLNNAISIFQTYLQKYGDADFLIGNYSIEGTFNFIPLTTPTVLKARKEIFNSYIANKWYIMACGKLINRNFFIQNSLWFEVGRLHEDMLFSFRLALSASKMITVREPVYKYIIRDGSITIARKDKNYIDIFWILTEEISMIKKNITLFEGISSYSYTISILFQFAISVSTSQLAYRKKVVFFMWVKKQLQLVENRHGSLKMMMEVLVLSISPFISIELCKIVDLYSKLRIR